MEKKQIKPEQIEAALRLVRKLLPFLQRKGKNAVVTQLALEILLIDIETDFGLFMTLEDRLELKTFLKQLRGEG